MGLDLFPSKPLFTNDVINSVIGAKIQQTMSSYQDTVCLSLITETNEPHPIKPKHTVSNSSVSSKQTQLCFE